tara:strand:+ start:222 stop:515 length:294 start_codon:yes stop_codon:yes gene_type:complete
MPDLCLSNEEQAQFYDTVEHELTVAARDLMDTIARMDHVQKASREHFTMPVNCLYELSGIISQALINHTEVLNLRRDQEKLDTLYSLKKIRDNYYAK